MESPILIDVWTVDSARQHELVRVLTENFQRLIPKQPGFVSAQIYESANGGTVLMEIRMQSAEDRRRMTDAADVQQAYREVRKIASSHRHFYRLVASFGESSPPPL
ncbi:MAG TPA: hypothetical protein VHY83_12080 [Solirubrobacteraceae bacterium]|jgi:hypothetical protein|nr:hypothetical protein [Solirubrobacteraceae bacterium]